MPLIDKPLEELHRYQGTNPCPIDFTEYWDSSLRELAGHDPRVSLVRNETITPRGIECFDLWFTGVGGARIHAKYLRPEGGSKCPAVLQFHGYAGDSGDWQDKLVYVSQGFCVAALDCRGQAGLSEDLGGVRGNTHNRHLIRGLDDPDPRKLLFRSIFLDTALLARVIMDQPEVDSARVASMGGSQGGALAMVCAALEPRIYRISVVYPFLSDYRRVWEMDQAKDAYDDLRQFFRMFDPRHQRETEIFTKLGYIDCQHLAARVRGEVLMFTGLMDTICPPSTQFAVYNKITSPKAMVVYPDFAHEWLPGQADRTLNFLLKP